MFENWNSLGGWMQSWKFDRLNYLIKRLNIDVVAESESQKDWYNDNQFRSLLAPGSTKKGITSHKSTERINFEQMGGTS